jgi:hypothetical protein
LLFLIPYQRECLENTAGMKAARHGKHDTIPKEGIK